MTSLSTRSLELAVVCVVLTLAVGLLLLRGLGAGAFGSFRAPPSGIEDLDLWK